MSDQKIVQNFKKYKYITHHLAEASRWNKQGYIWYLKASYQTIFEENATLWTGRKLRWRLIEVYPSSSSMYFDPQPHGKISSNLIFWKKVGQRFQVHLSWYKSKHSMWRQFKGKIENTLNWTIVGWRSMHQRLRIYFS